MIYGHSTKHCGQDKTAGSFNESPRASVLKAKHLPNGIYSAHGLISRGVFVVAEGCGAWPSFFFCGAHAKGLRADALEEGKIVQSVQRQAAFTWDDATVPGRQENVALRKTTPYIGEETISKYEPALLLQRSSTTWLPL